MPELRPVIVGEANPYGGDPWFAMYPSPERSSGHRLCVLVLGMGEDAYLAAFRRVNLCWRDWSMVEARESAARLVGRDLILCGAKVCKAFDVPYAPFESQFPGTPEGGGSITVIPHPSGLCRAWSVPGAFERARAAIVEAIPRLRGVVGD